MGENCSVLGQKKKKNSLANKIQVLLMGFGDVGIVSSFTNALILKCLELKFVSKAMFGT